MILLDEAVVYNTSHLLGFLSVFNADAIKNMELTKEECRRSMESIGFGSDINMKDGNSKKFKLMEESDS